MQKTTSNLSDELLTTKESARILKCSEAKLEKDRFENKGIPFTRLGRKVLYRSSDIQKYLDAHAVGAVS